MVFFPRGKKIPKQTKVNFSITAMVLTIGALTFIRAYMQQPQDLKEKNKIN